MPGLGRSLLISRPKIGRGGGEERREETAIYGGYGVAVLPPPPGLDVRRDLLGTELELEIHHAFLVSIIGQVGDWLAGSSFRLTGRTFHVISLAVGQAQQPVIYCTHIDIVCSNRRGLTHHVLFGRLRSYGPHLESHISCSTRLLCYHSSQGIYGHRKKNIPN